MKSSIQKWTKIASLMSMLLLYGCNSTGTNDHMASMSLNFAAQNASSSSKIATTQADELTITEAKMLIKEVELESSLEDDGAANDTLDFETGPLVVSLNLDGTPNEVSINEVPAGSYDEIEFEVHKPEDGETPPDPDFKTGSSGNERFSVIIKGTFNGQDFLYRSRENMEQELELAHPLVINDDTGNTNLTLSVDLSLWFKNENGTTLDPTAENNRSRIDDSIKRSFEAFKDNDKDGEED